MYDKVNSPIFGEVEILTEDQEMYSILHQLIKRFPVNTFAILNKMLNEKSLYAQIDLLKPTSQEESE